MLDDIVDQHYTPAIEKLHPFRQLVCSQADCQRMFSNQSNYQMHLTKHHKIHDNQAVKLEKILYFHCPGGAAGECAYGYGNGKGKHFKSMKLLRQHFQKVHLLKKFECSQCSKAFGTESQLAKHRRDVCGWAFACRDCGWSYLSMEALLTHGKRKGHNVRDIIRLSKKEIEKKAEAAPKHNKGGQQISTQTARPERTVKENCHEISVQTIDPSTIEKATSNCCSHNSAGVQTDHIPIAASTMTAANPDLSLDNVENHNFFHKMLAQSNMYTQTCDDFLSVLGLADIQTQTYWPSPEREVEENVQYTSTATSTNPCIHDELLVSTETQTSFTQCLLNSCSDAGTSTPPVSFGSLYHTQHTQTCDPLLEGFDFGGQASDLMDGFQSTYTQT